MVDAGGDGDPRRARFAAGPHQADGTGVRDLSAARSRARWRTRRQPARRAPKRPPMRLVAFQQAAGDAARSRRAAATGMRTGYNDAISLAAAADHDSRRQHVGQHLFPAHRFPRDARAGRPDRVRADAVHDARPAQGRRWSKTSACTGTSSTWCGFSCSRCCICFSRIRVVARDQ